MPAEDDPFALDYAEPFRPGNKVRFCGTTSHWFTNMIADAERELRVGEVYTLKTIRAYSSWTEVTLEETGSLQFNDLWFERLPTMPNV